MTEQEIQSLQQELKETKRQLNFFKTAIDALPNPIFLKDDQLRFLFFNKSYREFFHLTGDEFIGLGVMDLSYLNAEDRRRYQAEDSAALNNGVVNHYETTYPYNGDDRNSLYWSSGFATDDGQRGLVGEIVDISVEKRLAEEVNSYVRNVKGKTLAGMIDPLTKLFNDQAFSEHVPVLLNKCFKRNFPLYLMVLDLDEFDQVNRTFGEEVGDEILQKFAALLSEHTRKDDMAIRFREDEFILLLPGINEESVLSKADFLCWKACRELKLPDGSVVSTSIGISACRADLPFDATVLQAQEALYAAKQAGRNCARLFTEDMRSVAQ